MIEHLTTLTQQEYRALDAISQSDLKKCWENPQLYAATRGQYDPPSKSQQWGSDFEQYLRSGTVDDVLVIPSDVLNADGHRKGKKWLDFSEYHRGKRLFTIQEVGELRRAFTSVLAHEHAAKLVYSKSARWTQRFAWEQDGERFKCEMDLLDQELSCITDIKTAADVDPRSFESDVIRWGYDIQAAMYLRAARLLDMEREWAYAWVVVRNCEPFNVEVYQASDDLLEFGERRLQERIDFFLGCRRSGRWLSPTHGTVVMLYPPAWAVRSLA
jgi:hypothetical protein